MDAAIITSAEINNKKIIKLNPLQEPEMDPFEFNDGDLDILLGSNCLPADTKITMADGSFKYIRDINEGDMVLSFDHEKGCFTESPILYAYKGDEAKPAFTLHFSNAAFLSIVGEHDLFEKESRHYVTISKENAPMFIGKHFYSAAEKSYVKLLDVTYETDSVDFYEIYSAKTLNTVANGMLNVADDVDYHLNIYKFDENLKADSNVLTEDIKKFGFHPYSDVYRFTEKEYNDWNMKYINVIVGKGLKTMSELEEINTKYLNDKQKR